MQRTQTQTSLAMIFHQTNIWSTGSKPRTGLFGTCKKKHIKGSNFAKVLCLQHAPRNPYAFFFMLARRRQQGKVHTSAAMGQGALMTYGPAAISGQWMMTVTLTRMPWRAVLTENLDWVFFLPKRPGQLHFPPEIAAQQGEKGEGLPKTRGTEKWANTQSRNAERQSGPEPQSEAQFAGCAIFGDRRLFTNAEVAPCIFGKKSLVKILAEGPP